RRGGGDGKDPERTAEAFQRGVEAVAAVAFRPGGFCGGCCHDAPCQDLTMLAVENGPPPFLTAAPRRTGRIPRAGRVTGCPIGGSTLLVIGTGGPMPSAAPATLNDDPAEMSSAAVVSWRLGAPLPTATHGFAALLPTNSADSAFATVQFEQEGAPKRYVFTPRTVSVNEAAALLAELCGSRLAATIDALADLLIATSSDPHRL